MPSCSVASCRSRTNKMHSFPDNVYFKHQWTVFCGHPPTWIPFPSSKICSRHFLTTDITSRGRVKENAVPQVIGGKASSVKRSGTDDHICPKRLCKVSTVVVSHTSCFG